MADHFSALRGVELGLITGEHRPTPKEVETDHRWMVFIEWT